MPPDFINRDVLWGPLFALGVFVALALAAGLIQVIFRLVLSRQMRTAPDALDTQMLATVRGPSVLFIMILGLVLSFVVFTGLTHENYEFMEGWDKWARKAWLVLIIAEVSYLASNLAQVMLAWYIRTVASRSTATSLEAKLLPPVRRILPITVYAIGLLIALDGLEVSISPLLAGFGIGGLAVALAVQPTLSNFFAGTYLVTEGELREGDYIELEGGPAGYVVEVGWRSTKIRNRMNNLVIIPNSKMVESIVTNYYSPTPAMSVVVTCGVSYDADLHEVERIVMEVANEVIEESTSAVKSVEPFFGFSEFGDSNIDFWVFLQAHDRFGTFTLTSDLVKGIHRRFQVEGIEINYPVRKLVQPSVDECMPVASPQIEAQRDSQPDLKPQMHPYPDLEPQEIQDSA